MGKALMVGSFNATVTSGWFAMLCGPATMGGTEANCQYSATEAATFSRLRSRITSGGSGTNTCRFRVAGANGNMSAARASTGNAEDLDNTDVLSAGDLFNVGFTDTGTDPSYSFWRCIVELASGHGNFYGAANTVGVVYDLASTTSFMPLNGRLEADGEATEANVAFRNRAHDSWEALQVRVTANARANDTTVRNRIAAGNGSAAIVIGAGLTGLFTATGLGDAVADGDALCASITTGAGVEDLTVTFVGATLKSSAFRSEVFGATQLGATRTAGTTPHYGNIGGSLSIGATTSEAIRQVPLGFAATVSNLRAYVTANTYTGNMTVRFRVNGATAIQLTINAGATGWQENAADSVEVGPEDLLTYEYDEGTANSITMTMVGITVDATPRIAAIVHNDRRRRAA